MRSYASTPSKPFNVACIDPVAVSLAAYVMADRIMDALVESTAEHFTCGEIATIANLYRALGYSAEADQIIASHSEGDDDEGDEHYRGY
jgi:hypothetical protein